MKYPCYWADQGLVGDRAMKMIAFDNQNTLWGVTTDGGGLLVRWDPHDQAWIGVPNPRMLKMIGFAPDPDNGMYCVDMGGNVAKWNGSDWNDLRDLSSWTLKMFDRTQGSLWAVGTGANLGQWGTWLDSNGNEWEGWQQVPADGPHAGFPGRWYLDWLTVTEAGERYCVGTEHNLGIYDINTNVMNAVDQPWNLKMVAFDRNKNLWCVSTDGNIGAYCATAPLISDDEKLRLLTAYAPRVWLAKGEKYLPSSVEFAFRFLERFRNDADSGRHWLRTKEHLKAPSDVLEYFHGDLDSASVYAFWVEKYNAVIDLVYYFYYPYNRGKSVLNTKWGNHVSDWEHVTVRLMHTLDPATNTWSYQPRKLYASAHNFGGSYRWDEVKKVDTHPVVYSAEGSHGSYIAPGNYVYRKIPQLVDECSEGLAWDTWKRVTALDYVNQKGLGLSKWPLWMNTSYTNPGHEPTSDPANGPIYRWGNPKQGCILEPIAGECQLNDGPTGPADKSVWDPAIFE